MADAGEPVPDNALGNLLDYENLLAVEPESYAFPEVDERAAPQNEVNLIYPEAALAESRSGVVTLRLKIDHLGVLRDAVVVDAQPAGVFENAALEAVRELRFRPAVRNGVPVGSVKTIEVPFHPDCTRTGSCITGAGTSAQVAPAQR
jgi:TonB family protein